MAEKPTFEELWNTEFFQQHAHAALRKAIESHEDEIVSAFEQAVRKCESPLEAAFAAWWLAMGHCWRWEIYPQYQETIHLEDQTYRLDLVLSATHYGMFGALSDSPHQPKIAIELDGHEFHERTKEQVMYRNQRDRVLTLAGWRVWHISGSEFHRDPYTTVYRAYRDAVSVYCDAMRAAGAWRKDA